MRKTGCKAISAFISILMAALMCISGCSGTDSNDTEAQSLYEQGLDVIQLMREMADAEKYTSVYSSSREISDVIQTVRSGSHNTPKAVYTITVSNDDLALMGELATIGDISDELHEYLVHRTLLALVTQLNGMSGAANLAAASLISASKTFVDETVSESAIYIYTYDNAVPAAVTFIPGENGAVSASGTFILYDDFTCGSASEIKEFFSEISVQVEELAL